MSFIPFRGSRNSWNCSRLQLQELQDFSRPKEHRTTCNCNRVITAPSAAMLQGQPCVPP
jgi:hypothetical protein